MKAIRIHGHGGPETLRYETVDLAEPADDEVQVRHTVIGVNYSDLNVCRGGFYPVSPPLPLPTIIGNEAVGVVTKVGRDVTAFSPGQRVAYVKGRGAFYADLGSYAEFRNLPATRLFPIPDELEDERAAGVLLKGLTAATLIKHFHTPERGETVLIHAAASGVGLLLTAWAAGLGATVIATVGSADKANLARRHGASHCVLYRELDFRAAVKEIKPDGVDVVFDGVGADTLLPSLDVIRRHGKVINFGNASGPPPAIDLLQLVPKGSPWVTRAAVSFDDLNFYRDSLKEIFDLVLTGTLPAHIDRVLPLSDAAAAHEAVASGQTTGSILLRP